MLRLLLALAVCFVVASASPKCRCGVRPRVDTSPRSGRKASSPHLEKFPWLALIGRYTVYMNGTVVKLKCGGSLINSEWVLSSANCVAPSRNPFVKLELIYVFLNVTDPSESRDWNNLFSIDKSTWRWNATDRKQVANAYRVKAVRQYTPGTLESVFKSDNVAVVQLDRPVQFNEHVNPICLPNYDFVHKVMTFAGRGDFDYDRPNLREELKIISVKRVNMTRCDEAFYNPNLSEWRDMCFEKGDGDCNGDAGNPYIEERHGRFYAGSLSSFGSRFCSKYPRSGPKLSSFFSWIQKNANTGQWCSQF